jgi:hypothetical protein
LLEGCTGSEGPHLFVVHEKGKKKKRRIKRREEKKNKRR